MADIGTKKCRLVKQPKTYVRKGIYLFQTSLCHFFAIEVKMWTSKKIFRLLQYVIKKNYLEARDLYTHLRLVRVCVSFLGKFPIHSLSKYNLRIKKKYWISNYTCLYTMLEEMCPSGTGYCFLENSIMSVHWYGEQFYIIFTADIKSVQVT